MENSTVKVKKKSRGRRKLVISRVAKKAGIKNVRQAVRAGWSNEMIMKHLNPNKATIWNARSAMKREGIIIPEPHLSFWQRVKRWFTK